MNSAQAKALLRQMFDAAIASADPAMVLADHLPEKPTGRCIVVGAGKSAAAMARAVEIAWPDVDISGVVVTRYDHGVPTQKIKVIEASHPEPDAQSEIAAKEILEAVKNCTSDDLVLALISGGGSALMALPKPPLTLQDKVAVNKALLRSGLTIEDMNKIRRRLSLIKGGGLARAAQPAKLVTLAISDVPGDDPAAIASGPTVPDPSVGDDLSMLIEKLSDALPDAARKMLLAPVEDNEIFQTDYRLIATPKRALDAAAKVAKDAGINPIILGDALEGDAKELGVVMAGITQSVLTHGTPVQAPAVILSGGETTVSIGDQKPGRGGRNTEFLLSLGVTMNASGAVYALAGDTDGIDGTEDAAGAIIGPDFLTRCADAKISPKQYLQAHDSYSLFEKIDAMIKTGPTLTNVNDFRAILVV